MSIIIFWVTTLQLCRWLRAFQRNILSDVSNNLQITWCYNPKGHKQHHGKDSLQHS